MDETRQAIGAPSAFFRAHLDRLRQAAGAGRVLDLACGRGRHALAAAAHGFEVLAVDRNTDALDGLAGIDASPGRIETRAVDLESGTPPDMGADAFSAVLVFRYLHRPLMPWIEKRVAEGGLLFYETFTTDQRALGWGPTRDAFLLEPGELPDLFPGLVVEVFEEGPSADEKPAQTARLLATRPR